MYVLFTVGREMEFMTKYGVRSEFETRQFFVPICEYTDEEMRQAWYLVESKCYTAGDRCPAEEVVTFEVLGNREYDERLVDFIAQYAGYCDAAEIRSMWPTTLYADLEKVR